MQYFVDVSRMILVFGSNEAGIHGAGAARFAYDHKGATRYQGFGLSGKSFAIPTKDYNIRTLPLNKIEPYVQDFIKFAQEFEFQEFQLTRIGCGLAGYSDAEIAPLFKDIPHNVWIDAAWQQYFPHRKAWGTA